MDADSLRARWSRTAVAQGRSPQAGRRAASLALAVWYVFPLSAFAQQKPTKVHRIGILSAGHTPGATHKALRAGLQEMGYVLGKNLVFEERFAEARYERMPQLATELVALKVDVLVTTGTPATLAAKNATSTIPIVMTNTGDAVGTGLITGLARPGGNITGMTIYSPELFAKRLDLIKEALPHMRRVAALMNPDNVAQERSWQAIETMARSLKVELQRFDVRAPGELESVFAAMARERVDALVLPVDTIFGSKAGAIADLAAKHRLPAIGPGVFAAAGLLMTYGVLPGETDRRIAYFVDRVLRGARPADLPVELPTRFEFVVNLKAAKALGITLPTAILARADRVIE